MNPQRTVDSLARLIELKQQQVDQLAAEVAGKEALRQRYRHNLERLGALAAGSGASGAPASPALALNRANYKQSVLTLMVSHQQELALHEADMAAAQRALTEASRKREVLVRTLEQKQDVLQRAQAVREQKRQDDLAAQVWWRQRA
jgi:flagellar export protein FliJ